MEQVIDYLSWLMGAQPTIRRELNDNAMEEMHDIADIDSIKDDKITVLSEPDPGIVMTGATHQHQILTRETLSLIHSGLPAKWRVLTEWRLVYATEAHGWSLSTLYKHSEATGMGCGLLVIKARGYDQMIIGAFLTHPVYPHSHHFGTGECFLFSCCFDLNDNLNDDHLDDDGKRNSGDKGNQGKQILTKYGATGKNDYFILANQHDLAVGCGEGRFGLWIGGRGVSKGSSSKCLTYSNPHSLLGPEAKEDFDIEAIELWSLV